MHEPYQSMNHVGLDGLAEAGHIPCGKTVRGIKKASRYKTTSYFLDIGNKFNPIWITFCCLQLQTKLISFCIEPGRVSIQEHTHTHVRAQLSEASHSLLRKKSESTTLEANYTSTRE